jgi:hypothetical protein
MSVNEVPTSGAPAGPDAPADMSSLARIPAVVWSPARAFAAIVSRPTVLVAFLVLVLFHVAVASALYVPVFAPFQRTQTLERLGDMNAQQKAAVERQQQFMDTQKGRVIGAVTSGFFVGLIEGLQILVWAALLYFLLTLLMSGRAGFRAVFSVAVYAAVVDMLHWVALIPLAVARQDPRIYFGPAALMDAPDPPTFVYTLLTRFDVFSLWAWALAAVGLSLLYRKKMGQVAMSVGGLFVVHALFTAWLQSAMASFFKGMGG